jgi:hypothetical protein
MWKIAVGFTIGLVAYWFLHIDEYKDPLSVGEVDGLLEQFGNFKPMERMAIKSLLARKGVMDQGRIEATHPYWPYRSR